MTNLQFCVDTAHDVTKLFLLDRHIQSYV